MRYIIIGILLTGCTTFNAAKSYDQMEDWIGVKKADVINDSRFAAMEIEERGDTIIFKRLDQRGKFKVDCQGESCKGEVKKASGCLHVFKFSQDLVSDYTRVPVLNGCIRSRDNLVAPAH